MATCRDCIHHLICAVYAPNFDDVLANGESCSEFENGSHFVKVVRCKDCKYHRDLDGGVKCQRIDGLLMNFPDDYCSYGRRQDS